MSLTVSRVIDITDPNDANAYFRTGNFAIGGGDQRINTGGFSPPRKQPWYYDRLDYCVSSINGPEVGARLDPSLITNVGSLYDYIAAPPGLVGYTATYFYVGEFNRDLNQQRLYMGANTLGNPLREVDPTTFNEINADVFPNLFWSGSNNGKSFVADPANNGFWDFINGSQGAHIVYFESRNEALVSNCRTVQNGATLQEQNVIVNLVTGDALLVTEWGPVRETLFGFTNVVWRYFQFVPDDDSTVTSPKGFLVFLSDAQTQTGVESRTFVKTIDWNPDDVQGTPQRVHQRRTLTSIFRVGLDNVNPQEITQPDTIPNNNNATGSPMIFHPPTRTLIYWAAGFNVAAGENPLENMVVVGSLTPAFDEIFGPSAINNVETADDTRYTVLLRGDLGEKIAGITVDWAIEKASALNELLVLSGDPPTLGQTVSTAFTMIDGDDFTAPVVIRKDGVPMTEGAGATEYTLDRANSQITFGANEPVQGSIYDASYRHFDDPDPSASYGTLLIPQSQSDAEGRAETRVRYPDDSSIVGQFDLVRATTVGV